MAAEEVTKVDEAIEQATSTDETIAIEPPSTNHEVCPIQPKKNILTMFRFAATNRLGLHIVALSTLGLYAVLLLEWKLIWATTRPLINDPYLYLKSSIVLDNRDGHWGPYQLEHFPDPQQRPWKVASLVYGRLNKKVNGTFLEYRAGRGDGDTSVTLALEARYNWSGILLEPVPKTFAELKKKNRKAVHVKACLATGPEAHTLEMELVDDFDCHLGTFVFTPNGDSNEVKELCNRFNLTTFCYTLQDILEATDLYGRIDLLYMRSIYGFELETLKAIKLEDMDILSIVVDFLGLLPIDEVANNNNQTMVEEIESYLADQGYALVGQAEDAFMFKKMPWPYARIP